MRPLLTRLVALAALFLPLPALAGGVDGAVQARILPGWTMADGSHMTALHLTLGEGWKTYWRAPGDAGIPPRFDWRRSRNLGAVEVSWPAPRVILQAGVRTIGYADSLVLPLKLTPKAAGRDIRLAGQVEIGVCKEVCVPITLRLSQDLQAGTTKPDPRIAAALASVPFTAREAGLRHVSCRISPVEDGLHLQARIELPASGGQEVVVIETDNPAIWVAQAKSARSGGTILAETRLYHVDGKPFALDRSGLRLTVLGRKHAVDIRGCPSG